MLLSAVILAWRSPAAFSAVRASSIAKLPHFFGLIYVPCAAFGQPLLRTRGRHTSIWPWVNQRLSQKFLEKAGSRGEHVHGIAYQETWLMDDDELEIAGYRWFGRNRTRIKESSRRRRSGKEKKGRPSDGVGLLVSQRLLRGAVVKKREPT